MRQGSRRSWLLPSLLFVGACGATKGLPDDGGSPLSMPDSGGSPNAAGDALPADAAGPSFCTGAPSLTGWTADPTTPFATLSDDSGQGCVFLLGDVLADPQVCGVARPTGYTETECPVTTVDFRVWSDPYFMTEFAVQGSYAFVSRSGTLQDGRVLAMVIDSATADMTRGHFQVAFDPSSGFAAATATGTFALCTTAATSVEPCRQPKPLAK